MPIPQEMAVPPATASPHPVELDVRAVDLLKQSILARVQIAHADFNKGAEHILAVWREGIRRVADGEAEKVHARRDRFLGELKGRLADLAEIHRVVILAFKHVDDPSLNPDGMLPRLAELEKLLRRLSERWHSVEDLEDLAVEDYPLSQPDLDRIGPTRKPPQSWYAETSTPR